MYKQTIRHCPICSLQQAEVLHTHQFIIPTGVPLPHEYDIVCCLSCNFVYADTPNSQEQYENYYAKYAKYDPSITTADDNQRHNEVINYLKNYINKKTKVIDIGCSNGNLLKNLREQGYYFLTGVDPSPICIKHITKDGIQGHTLTLSKICQNNKHLGPYNCVILSHIMEHLVNPNDMITAIRGLVASNNLVYIEVPDASRYLSHFYKSFHFFDVEHINHFDKVSLINLAHQNGFEVIDVGSKIVNVSPSVKIPAAYILLSANNTKKHTLKKSTELKQAIIKYIATSHQNAEVSIINQLAKSQEPVILWGVGSYTQNLLTISPLKHCNIVCIVDKDPKKQGLKILNKVIKNPDILTQHQYPNATILIASIPFSEQIRNEIMRMDLGYRTLSI